jgi:uncharacterized protein
VSISDLVGEGAKKLAQLRAKWVALIGEYTFDDIVKELEKPGRDPRDLFKVFHFRDDIFEVKDLKQDMICPGLVTNVTNFGAFVDIGVHQDGLVHISELSHKFIDDPRKLVNPGDQVTVKVIGIDLEKNQIALSMKMESSHERKSEQRPAAREGNADHQRSRGGEGGSRPHAGGGAAGGRPGGRPHHQGGGRDNRGAHQGAQAPAKPQGKPFNNPFAALQGLNKK